MVLVPPGPAGLKFWRPAAEQPPAVDLGTPTDQRYWVGGTDTWNAIVGTKWAYTSGGPGGVPVPTSANDVYFDANSGSGTITLSGTGRETGSLDFTGFTGTFAGSQVDVAGSLTLDAGGTYTISQITFIGGAGAKTVSFGGANVTSTVFVFEDADSTWTLLDDVLCNTLSVFEGTLDISNRHVAVLFWSVNPTATLIPTGSEIEYVGDGAVFEFYGGGATYNTFSNHTTGDAEAGWVTIYGDNTFNILDIGAADNRTVKFEDGSTNTVQQLISSGGANHILTSNSESASFTLVDTSGTNTLANTTVSWSDATGGATWIGGTDGGNNSGWTFGAAGVDGDGALVATGSAVAGAGLSSSSGTGAANDDAATLAGAGVSSSIGVGALASQSSAASGSGILVSTGSGAVNAQAAAVAGTGAVASSGAGTLVSDAATVGGAGVSSSAGTGSVVAEPAAVAGTGSAAAANSGALVAESATVAGEGVSSSIGVGALAADATTIAGSGLSVSTGTGALACSSVTVAGVGVVLEEGATTGTGELFAGTATISGEGEVTGEVAPPITEGSGGYHYRPDRRPLPVEGYGYGILPQIEGEAHGVVGAAGRSIGALPRLAGLADAASGAAGSSSAQISLKAAALGNAGTRGRGSGMIVKFEAAAVGRHDDDEAAIVAWLLAA